MEQGKEWTIIGHLTLRASRAQDHGGLREAAQSRRKPGLAPRPHPVWLRAAARSSNSQQFWLIPHPYPARSAGQKKVQSSGDGCQPSLESEVKAETSPYYWIPSQVMLRF